MRIAPQVGSGKWQIIDFCTLRKNTEVITTNCSPILNTFIALNASAALGPSSFSITGSTSSPNTVSLSLQAFSKFTWKIIQQYGLLQNIGLVGTTTCHHMWETVCRTISIWLRQSMELQWDCIWVKLLKSNMMCNLGQVYDSAHWKAHWKPIERRWKHSLLQFKNIAQDSIPKLTPPIPLDTSNYICISNEKTLFTELPKLGITTLGALY